MMEIKKIDHNFSVCQVEDSEGSGCDIYAATSHAAGI